MPPPVHAPPLDPELIVTHDPFVRGLARRLLRDAHAADDVAQQTWIAACRRSVAAASLRDWLGAVARRIAGKRARADRRELLRQHAVARPEQLPSTTSIVEREALRAAVVRAVLELAEPYRTVVLLRWFEDLPPRAIARRLQVPVETVRTRQKRALAELRARLDRHAGGDRAAWCALLVPIACKKGHTAASGGLFSFVAGVTLMSLPVRLALAGLLLAGALASTLWFLAGAPLVPPHEPTATVPSPEPADASLGAPAAVPALPEAAATSGRSQVDNPVATTGALLVRAVFHDQTPAVGVEIELYRFGASDVLRQCRAVTDEKGELRFSDEAPGRAVALVLRPDGNGMVRGEIRAGQETVLDVAVPRGIDARGIVVDGSGAAVAGAEVVAADWGGQAAHVLAHTAADGTFAVRSVSTHCHIGARASGWCASSMHTVTAGEGAAVELRIVLSQPAATVAGIVLGPDDRPAGDAVVRVGSDQQDNHKLPDGTQAMAPRPMVVRTGADGRFVATCLPAGKLPLAVRMLELAPWEGTVEVAAGERREVTVRLQPGVTLTGVVRDEGGAPVAQAEVSVGEWGNLGHQRRTTDGHGAFTFVGLPVGEVKAVVERDGKGKAETTLRGLAGETLRWEPVLSAGIVLRGRVVDENDQPVDQVIVEARAEAGHEGGNWWGFGDPDANGRFQLENCKPGVPIRIEVRRHSMRELILRNVVPGADELVVRLPKVAWTRVKGKAVGPGGKPLPNVEIHVSQPGAGGDLETLDPASGAFDVGPYPPGELSLKLETPGFAPIFVRRTLRPDEVWDLGTLTFARGGTLELNLVGDSAAPLEGACGSVYDDQGVWVSNLEIKGGRVSGGPWAAGDYVLQVTADDLAAVRHPFSLRAGTVTKLDLPVQRGVPVVVTFALPDGAAADSVPLEVLGAGDALALRTSAWRRDGGPHELRTVLRPGSYRVRVPDGEFAGETAFEVTAPGPVETKVALRAR